VGSEGLEHKIAGAASTTVSLDRCELEVPTSRWDHGVSGEAGSRSGSDTSCIVGTSLGIIGASCGMMPNSLIMSALKKVFFGND